ncbi:MAG: signal recognition particle protein [Oscillospiraceae bacterium]|nr:signal recognition particle protein [Oscillospiraceae bacterium]
MALFEGLSSKLQQITAKMRGKTRVTEQDIKDMMREIRLALLEADVNYQVIKQLIAVISEKCSGAEVLESLTPGQQVVKVVHDSMVDILNIGEQKLAVSPSGFTVLMLYGLQGSGKTTTAAKLARYLKNKGKKVLLTSVDTHRPAAMLQLDVLAKSIDVPCYIEAANKDAVEIARHAVDRARYLLCDTLIVDTAGRMTIDQALMTELKQVAAVVKPTQKLLIVDAMIGQEAVNIAETFDREIGLDGYIMTKLDGDARGGAALSIAYNTHKPIKFITIGEKTDALEAYDPERMANRILGMGDVVSLIEKATANYDEKVAQKTLDRLKKNQFTLSDMLTQFEQVSKMGSVKDLLGMIPGVSSAKLKDAKVDDSIIHKNMAIIRSMTPRERDNPQLLNASRRKRIAQGSGTSVQAVNQLINQYQQTLKMMKQLGGFKGKKGRGFPGMGRGGFPF